MTAILRKDIIVQVAQPVTPAGARVPDIGLVEITQPVDHIPGPPGPPGPGVVIQDTPPDNPKNGTLWWESDSGILYSWYVETDGSSSQWVQVVAPTTAVATGVGTDVSDAYVTARGGSTLRSLADWFAGIGRVDLPPPWPYYWKGPNGQGDGPDPDNIRIRRRLFIGQAADYDDLKGGTVQPDWGVPYASWIGRNADLAVMAVKGTLAISAMARTMDKVGLTPTPSTWALGGYVLNDAAGESARVLYLEAQREAGTSGTPIAELVGKNKGTSHTAQPYQGGGGIDGIWLVAGGDPAYGGTAANPCNTGLLFMYGSTGGPNYRWNRGITFRAGSISGSDNSDADTGTSVAVEMAKQHEIRWARPNSATGAYIRSQVGNTGEGGAITFVNGGLQFMGSDGVIAATIFTVASTANYLAISPNIAGQPVYLQALGTDANIPIRMVSKGTSGLLFRNDVSVTTSSINPSTTFSGRIQSNEGAGSLITYTLPATAQGLVYAAYCAAAVGVRIVAPAGSTIRIGASVSASGGRVDSTVVGSFIEIVAVNATSWVAKYSTGTWTVT